MLGVTNNRFVEVCVRDSDWAAMAPELTEQQIHKILLPGAAATEHHTVTQQKDTGKSLGASCSQQTSIAKSRNQYEKYFVLALNHCIQSMWQRNVLQSASSLPDSVTVAVHDGDH
jgi:hypothetical protein